MNRTPDVDTGKIRVREIPAKTMVLAVVVVAGAWTVLQLLPVLLVVAVSLFLVGTLNPAVEWLEARRVRRSWGIALVFTGMLVTSLLVLALTVPPLLDQLTTLAKQEPAIRDHIAATLSRWRVSAPLAESLHNVRYEALAQTAASMALAYSTRVVAIVAYTVSSVFLALYVMIDRDRLRGGLFSVVPRTHHIRLSRVLLNLETIVGGYIRGQVLTSVLMSVFVFALLMVTRVPNAIALAVFAGLADVLPYVGVFLSVGPSVIAALSVGPAAAGIVLVAMFFYEEFESRFLVPRIYGRALRLPSSVVLVALLAGGTLLGVLGALLALPVAAAIRMLVEELRLELPGEQIDDTKLRARDDRAEKEYERRTEGVPAEQAAAIAVEISVDRQAEETPAAGDVVPLTFGRSSPPALQRERLTTKR
jgi:predicted PurR-regulated permease PerM